MSLANLVQRIKPSVVLILAETNLLQLPFTGEYIHRQNVPSQIREVFNEAISPVWSKGTGFVINAEEGLIGTAYHIFKDCPPRGLIVIHSFFGDPNLQEASVINVNDDADVAILQTEPLELPSLPLGNYDDGLDGLEIAFIGFPLKLNFHLTHKGIISGKTRIRYREDTRPVDVFTINSFVNRGNSGGPLFLIEDDIKVIGVINARRALNVQPVMLRLPPNYKPFVTLGGIDPLGLTVETYNRAVGMLGDVGQVGIGFCTSIDYIRGLIS